MRYTSLKSAALLVVLAAIGPGMAAETAPVPPRVLANLCCTVGRPLQTLGGPSTCGAVAMHGDQVLLAEVHQGGVYLSELDVQAATARWTVPIAAAVAGRERSRVQLAVARNTAWVTWLERDEGASAGDKALLTLVSLELGTSQPQAPVGVAETTAAAATAHNQQLWLAWLGPPETGAISLSSGVPGAAYVSSWTPSAPGKAVHLALGDLGADLCLVTTMQEPERASIWLGQYDGRRMHSVRKLRQGGELVWPALCVLQDRILVLYTEYTEAGAGDLQLTVATTLGSDVVSTPLVADGRRNTFPSVTAHQRKAYLVYSASQGDTNLGLFLAEIESLT
jgi:hypothetical protein